MTIYDEWGLTPIINASGAVTRLGGARMPPAVVQAYVDAATESVPLDQLQAVASAYIREVTGAEAGLVTSGAAAALLLGTAAVLARYDLRRMEQLPAAEGFPNEFLIAREHRNGYDHAARAAGAKLVDVGFHEIISGAGVRRCEAWEFATAITPKTAGVLYVHTDDSQPPLKKVVAVAHEAGLPVVVDAAGELPPRANLRSLIETGADLVCFSGGKAIRGPQGTGILCGRKDLIGAAALQMLDMDDHPQLWEPPAEFIDRNKLIGMPRHGIGRSLKVSKEQILSLLTALRLFVTGAYDADSAAMKTRLERIAASLRQRSIDCRLLEPGEEAYPLLEVVVPSRLDAFEVTRRLRHGNPPIYVGHGLLSAAKLIIHPLNLSDRDCERLVERLREELASE